MTAAIASRTVYFRRWRFFSQDGAPGREMSVREPAKTGREAKKREIQPKNGPSTEKTGHPGENGAIRPRKTVRTVKTASSREKRRRGASSAGRDSPALAHRHRAHPGAVGAGPVQTAPKG